MVGTLTLYILVLAFTAVLPAQERAFDPQTELCNLIVNTDTFDYTEDYLRKVKTLVEHHGANPAKKCGDNFNPYLLPHYVFRLIAPTSEMTPLNLAAAKGIIPFLKYFIEELKINPNTGMGTLGGSPILYSSIQCRPNATEYLLKKGAKVYNTTWYPLESIIALLYVKNRLEYLRRMDEYRRTKNKATKYDAKVWKHALKNCYDTIEVLLKYGADPNYIPEVPESSEMHGSTLLHYAAKSGFLELYDLLVKYGAYEGAKNSRGQTPKELLRMYGRQRIKITFDQD